MAQASAELRAKSHYEILDGLRGVAAITVVIFHTFEAYDEGSPFKQILNHGYLAVDFFFLLSGFVVAYAYDDRWSRMTQWEFYKRRLIRLQPMVIAGSVIGAALFYLGRSSVFPLIATTPVWKVLVLMVVGMTLIPILPSMDIRGWDEMHPLDGPAWSLFFEYVANILYAVWLRRLSKRALAVVVALSAVLLVHMVFTAPNGDVIGGWAVNSTQLHIGFARLCYPFFAGMLLMRLGPRIHVKNAFLVSSLLLLATLAFPRIGTPANVWTNALYESIAILLVFPVIVAIGAGDRLTGSTETRICRFLGGLSYPLYITHYPLIYWYTGWVIDRKIPAREGAVVGAVMLLVAISVAWGCLKLYDEPVRAWLTRRFLAKGAPVPR